ncbi:MAG: hypothetical protein P4L77_12155 [Sulfuriferula sp.]|nr:hypothetical protein [Sulfuriferula sp.]
MSIDEQTAVATGAITTEKQTYRTYIQTSSDKDGKTVVDKIKAQAEASAKVTDKNDPLFGLATNWAKLEREGWTLLCENEFVRYNIKSVDGFFALVTDKDQQNYIIQCGLNYAMNAKANAAMVALKDGTPEPTPEFDGETIDLRVGVGSEGKYSINEPPSRKSLTDIEKLMKTLGGLNLTQEQKEAMLLQVAAAFSAQKEAGEETGETE